MRLLLTMVTAALCATTGCAQEGELPAPQNPEVQTDRLMPSDLEYVGAFRLPEASGGSSWEWAGDAMAYCPTGDSDGPDDGFPGSLYGIGHDWDKQVSEISIPVPVLSAGKRLPDGTPLKRYVPSQTCGPVWGNCTCSRRCPG